MGRAHEVRAASMAATAAKRSALYMRASKEIYMAAKSGEPDPNSNLALRAVLEKYKGQGMTKEVIQRAIVRAKGKDGANYIAGRYEGFGPGNAMVIVDTLSDNTNRAFSEVRAIFNHKGGKIGNSGSVSFAFDKLGVLDFEGADKDAVVEALVLGDVDVKEVTLEDGIIEVLVAPKDLASAEAVIKENFGVTDFSTNEVTLVPNQYVEVSGEEADKLHNFIDALDDLEDVQTVYHNAKFC